MTAQRDAVRTARSLVVKVGTNALTTASGVFDAGRLAGLADAIEARMKAGTDVVIVSSGAIAAGIEPLGLSSRPKDLATKQAAASVGQVALVNCWSAAFARYRPHGRAGAADRARYLDAGSAHQRPAHAGPAAGPARGGDRQRERHGGHQRDPVRRQRPAFGAGGSPGRRRRAGAAVRHRRPLRLRSPKDRRSPVHSRGRPARRIWTVWSPARAATWAPAEWCRRCRRRCWPPTPAYRCCWPPRPTPRPRSPTPRSARCSPPGPFACRPAGSGCAMPPRPPVR